MRINNRLNFFKKYIIIFAAFLLLFMTFNLRLFVLMFRSECADFSLYIYLSVYLIHGDKQQKSEHGIEARFYEIERIIAGMSILTTVSTPVPMKIPVR